MKLLSLQDVGLKSKRVVIREDFNVPMRDGAIRSTKRIDAAIPTLEYALSHGAAVIVLSHMGRPVEGEYDNTLSLAPVAAYLAEKLPYPVRFEKNYLEGVHVAPGELVLCENVRFLKGERANDPALAKALAKLGDIFVMDAFATAHRKEASTYGIAEYADIALAGPLLLSEWQAIEQALHDAKTPVMAVVGGSKISSKFSILEFLIEQVDVLIPGGGIANTLLFATGEPIGNSLYEPEKINEAKALLEKARNKGCRILLPTDVVVGKQFSSQCPAFNKQLYEVAPDDMILDVGPETAAIYAQTLLEAKTIIWNGPVGVFEFPQFSFGTREVAMAIANSDAYTLAGGGDTIAAIEQYDLAPELSYISTGGGAFLECLEGKTLPAIAILAKRGAQA